MNKALGASILLTDTEALPDLGTAALDEVLAVRVVVDHELDDFAGPAAAATDRITVTVFVS